MRSLLPVFIAAALLSGCTRHETSLFGKEPNCPSGEKSCILADGTWSDLGKRDIENNSDPIYGGTE